MFASWSLLSSAPPTGRLSRELGPLSWQLHPWQALFSPCCPRWSLPNLKMSHLVTQPGLLRTAGKGTSSTSGDYTKLRSPRVDFSTVSKSYRDLGGDGRRDTERRWRGCAQIWRHLVLRSVTRCSSVQSVPRYLTGAVRRSPGW